MHDLERQSDKSWHCRKCGAVFAPSSTMGDLQSRACHTLAPRTQTQMAQIRAGHLLIKQWMQEKGYTEE
jgi:ribosomal protein L37AE/L43A